MDKVKKSTFLFCLLAVLIVFKCCTEPNTDYEQKVADPKYLHGCVKQLEYSIVHDIFSPPVASRVYAYSCLAAYEAVSIHDSLQRTYENQLNEFNTLRPPFIKVRFNTHIASTIAFLEVGKALVFTEDRLANYQDSLIEEYKSLGVPDYIITPSINHGKHVAEDILLYANADGYSQLKTMEGYTQNEEIGRWIPTPPNFMKPIEPNWNKLRPFVMDSATQYMPVRPPSYDLDKKSTFYSDLLEVYDAVNNRTEEQELIANFWDCNPFKVESQGHLMIGTKKITPGAHWMSITGIACKTDSLDFVKSAEAYSMVAITIADGFISCWDEKYRSELIRPETVINAHIDTEWEPILQTPPFPEYTSGHSVVSGAAAVTLTHLFGEDFAFTDNSEVEYGLPSRDFESFNQAADEAAISRLYGGIHYMPAIENGVDQGKKVGKYVVNSITTRN